jgi:hypothetical protein
MKEKVYFKDIRLKRKRSICRVEDTVMQDILYRYEWLRRYTNSILIDLKDNHAELGTQKLSFFSYSTF